MQQRRPWLQVLVFVCACGGALAACGGGDETEQVSGVYRGTMQDSLVGTGTITATLVQQGTAMSGAFDTSFAAGNGGGSVSGSLNGTTLTLTVTPPQPIVTRMYS